MLDNICLSGKSTIYSKKESEDILNLADKTFVIPQENISGTAVEVTHEYVARPDLLGLQLYGNQSYGNLICKINGIQNPFELNEGRILFCPSPNILNMFIYRNGWDDEIVEEQDITSNYNDVNKPISKSKKEKRKANEAVVGDTRFKINYGNRIIIY